MTRVLLTSVCRPLGPAHGDALSVGYELLHGQVTRAQGLFSPRSLHLLFSLEYVAENVDAPCVVLHYPSRRELIAELRKGYDYVCVSFLLAVVHRMKEVVALVREHAPGAQIVLGGYGTVLSDEYLAPWGDHICREEGVAFMRRLLGEPAIEPGRTYKHPLIISRLEVFGASASRTGMIFAGLGCPNGCDFCCTSHFFKRRHIKLLPTGADIFHVVERYLEVDPDISLVVLDEDFLLNKRRALQFREEVLKSGRTISMFVFSSIKAISQYEVEQLVEMGIDGLWIGYEGTRSGYAKQQGRDPAELFRELKRYGIGILASMIVGMPYQDGPTVQEELDGLLALEPDLCQFLIYGPSPGTPFFDRVRRENLLREDLAADAELYYRTCDGFSAMVKHPLLDAQDIEGQQRDCFRQDFQRLGPTIYRSIDTWLDGYRTLSVSGNAVLRRKAWRFAREMRKAYAVFLPGRLFGPNRVVRHRIARLERQIHAALGAPTWRERLTSIVAVGAAAYTSLTLRLGLFQHPKLVKHVYRIPAEAPRPARIWRRLARAVDCLSVEQRPEQTVWLRLEGMLRNEDAAQVAERVRVALKRTRDHLVLDLERVNELRAEAARSFVKALGEHRGRIRMLLPRSLASQAAAAALAVFRLYQGPGPGVF
jgi:radical SAM superfamily enzyme YgiQ (UPF0313 family)